MERKKFKFSHDRMTVKVILEAPCSWSCSSEAYQAVIRAASIHGITSVVDLCVERRSRDYWDSNSSNGPSVFSVLALAASRGHVETVKSLVRLSWSAYQINHAIVSACLNDFPDVVSLLAKEYDFGSAFDILENQPSSSRHLLPYLSPSNLYQINLKHPGALEKARAVQAELMANQIAIQMDSVIPSSESVESPSRPRM